MWGVTYKDNQTDLILPFNPYATMTPPKVCLHRGLTGSLNDPITTGQL